jgi:hypothetical protein
MVQFGAQRRDSPTAATLHLQQVSRGQLAYGSCTVVCGHRFHAGSNAAPARSRGLKVFGIAVLANTERGWPCILDVVDRIGLSDSRAARS